MQDTGPYSYNPPFYLSVESKDIIINPILVTVDRVDLYCSNLSIQAMDESLRRYDNHPIDTGTNIRSGKLNTIERIKKFRVHGKDISVRYDTFHDKTEPQRLLITIHEPNYLVMRDLAGILCRRSGIFTISKIEIAWDFYTPFVYLLKEWMEKHLWLSHNHKKCGRKGDTYYISNLRKSVKGIRVYPRPKNSQKPEYLRVELELHRTIIKKLGLKFPLTPESLPTDFTKYFNFCELNIDGLLKPYLKANKADREIINFKATHPVRRYPNGSLRQQLTSDIDEIKYKDSLVNQMERVKELGLSNYLRFLKPIKEMEWIINGLAQKQGFNF